MSQDRAIGVGPPAVLVVVVAVLVVLVAACAPASAPVRAPAPAPAPAPVPATDNPEAGSDVVGPEVGSAGGVPVTVERLIDGDSMELMIDGAVVEVRLLGINAPELRTVAGDESCNGREARAAMEELVAAGDLGFEAGDRDRFDRVLGVLSASGRNLNEALVAEGWALGLWSADDPRLVDLMRAAADDGLGLWGATCGAPTAGLTVGEVQADAPGRDEEHLDQEWVEIVNPGDGVVDLAEWSLADETTSNRFPLPAIRLAPGGVLRVVTGAGSDDTSTPTSTVHLAQTDPVWNNRGETVLVVDPDGRVAAHRFVG